MDSLPIRLACAALAVGALTPGARGQQTTLGAPGAVPTNADVFGRLAVECLAEAPVPASVALDVPVPYLRSALTMAWTRAGRRIAADTSAAGLPGAARVEVRAESTTVAYGRAGRGRLGRRVTLGLRSRIVQNGAVVYDAPCLRSAADAVRTRDRQQIEDPAFGETVGAGPAASGLRRTGEAVVLAGALVTGTLLLFTLRSR